MGLEQHPLVDAIGEGRKAVSAARGKPLSASSRDSVSPPDDKSPPNGGGGGAGGLPRGPITYVTLSGFIGDGDDPGWFRLYIDETLNAWLAIRRIDVVNQERRKVEGMPAAGVDVVWLAHDAQISLARRQPLLDPNGSALSGRRLHGRGGLLRLATGSTPAVARDRVASSAMAPASAVAGTARRSAWAAGSPDHGSSAAYRRCSSGVSSRAGRERAVAAIASMRAQTAHGAIRTVPS